MRPWKRNFHPWEQILNALNKGKNHDTPLTGFNIPPLVPVAIALGSGIIAGKAFSGILPLEWVCCSLLFLALIIRVIKKEPLGIVPVALFFVLGHCLISFSTRPAFPQNHIVNFCDRKKVWIQGQISSVPERSGRRLRFYLMVERAGSTQQEAEPATGKIMLSVYDFFQELRFNEPISCLADIRLPHNFNNPNGFDYKGYMGLKGIYCTGWVKGNSLIQEGQGHKPRFLSFVVNTVQDYRQSFACLCETATGASLSEAFHHSFWARSIPRSGRAGYIEKKVGDRDAAAVLNALVTGDRRGIDQRLKNVFSRSGANHILAISGLHLSIVALVAFFVFIRIFSFFPFLVIPGHAQKLAAVFTLVPLTFYAILSGFSPSTQRALTMIVMVMLSHAIEKQADTLNCLAVAFIAILIVWPGALFSISFQLSFFAVLFILGGLSLVMGIKSTPETKKSPLKKIASGVGMFMGVSFLAILGTQPLVMHYFNQVSIAGVFTNLILIPVAGFMAVPLGLSALFIYPFSITLSGILVKIAGLALEPCISFLKWISEIPLAWAHTITPDILEISCYYLFFSGLFMGFKGMKKRGVLVVVTALSVFAAREYFLIHERYFNKDVSVFVLDVGQGNAALIEAPGGKRVLIDGGGFSSFSTFDTGERIVAPFLWFRRILILDAVVLTHPESDHMNGLIYIMENFRVGRFIKNRDRGKWENYQDLMAVVAQKNIRVEKVPGFDGLDLGDARLEFLYPMGGEGKENLNNNSIVSKLTHGEISILLPGDIMEKAEIKLVEARGKRLLSTVLVSPHHGSSTSSSDFFLDQVLPKSVIISCGFKNRYGFPHAAVVERYMKRGCRLFQTDRSGAVQILSTGSSYEILTSKGE